MIKKIIRLIAIAFITMIIGVCGIHLILTGTPFPQIVIEKLNNPLYVVGISKDGLQTNDGKIVRIKYVSELPLNSKIIEHAVENGIEIDKDENVFGLLQVHHRCGNDPVRYHLAKINLTGLVLYTGGKADTNISQKFLDDFLPKSNSRDFNENGLSQIDFITINHLLRYIEFDKLQLH